MDLAAARENLKCEVVGQLDVIGPVENLDQTSKIYGMKLTDEKCEFYVQELDSMKHCEGVDNSFDICGHLDVSEQLENLEKTPGIYGMKLNDGKSTIKVSGIEKKEICHNEMSVSEMVENFEKKIVGTAKNDGKCDANLMTDYTNDGKCDTKLITDYNEMTFGRLKPLKRGEVHYKKLAAVPKSKSGFFKFF